jgi:hypothetical protein
MSVLLAHAVVHDCRLVEQYDGIRHFLIGLPLKDDIFSFATVAQIAANNLLKQILQN